MLLTSATISLTRLRFPFLVGPFCNQRNCVTYKIILDHWQNCPKQECWLCSPLIASFDKKRLFFSSFVQPLVQQTVHQNPPADRSSNAEDCLWQRQVSQELRSNLVQRLVNELLSLLQLNAAQDWLVKEAQKVENEMFESAKSENEYIRLLFEKIFRIRDELRENGELIKAVWQQTRSSGTATSGSATPGSSTSASTTPGSMTPNGANTAAFSPSSFRSLPVNGQWNAENRLWQWQLLISGEQRLQMVQKIAVAALPCPDAKQKLCPSLIEHGQKVESGIYQIAKSREEYFQLVAKKVWWIQKAALERLEKKRAAWQQRQATSGAV